MLIIYKNVQLYKVIKMSKKGFFGANGRLAQKKAEEEKKNQMEENGEVYVPIGKVLI